LFTGCGAPDTCVAAGFGATADCPAALDHAAESGTPSKRAAGSSTSAATKLAASVRAPAELTTRTDSSTTLYACTESTTEPESAAGFRAATNT